MPGRAGRPQRASRTTWLYGNSEDLWLKSSSRPRPCRSRVPRSPAAATSRRSSVREAAGKRHVGVVHDEHERLRGRRRVLPAERARRVGLAGIAGVGAVRRPRNDDVAAGEFPAGIGRRVGQQRLPPRRLRRPVPTERIAPLPLHAVGAGRADARPAGGRLESRRREGNANEPS